MAVSRKQSEQTKEQELQIIREIHLIVSMVIDPQVKRHLLSQLLAYAKSLGIDLSALEEISSAINNIPQMPKYTSAIDQDLVIRPDQKTLYEVGNVLEAVCNLFPNKVSEKTKQSYISTGIEFNSKILNNEGIKLNEIKTLSVLSDPKATVAKKDIEGLNKFLIGEDGKSALASAKDFDAACTKFSKEARTTTDAKGKATTATWKELDDTAKTALNALEATRHDAAILITAEKKIGVVTEIKGIGAAINVQEKSGADQVAFDILKNIRESRQVNMSRGSAVDKLKQQPSTPYARLK